MSSRLIDLLSMLLDGIMEMTLVIMWMALFFFVAYLIWRAGKH